MGLYNDYIRDSWEAWIKHPIAYDIALLPTDFYTVPPTKENPMSVQTKTVTTTVKTKGRITVESGSDGKFVLKGLLTDDGKFTPTNMMTNNREDLKNLYLILSELLIEGK